MPPTVELSPSIFARLQAQAIPLMDTTESVITRILDFYEAKSGVPQNGKPDNPLNVGDTGSSVPRAFSGMTPPDLKFTRVLEASVNGKQLSRVDTTWNGILVAVIREAKSKAGTSADLKRLVAVNIVERRKEDDGFRFLADVGVSVQGQDSNNAWKGTLHTAKLLNIKVSVVFQWRQKDAAAFPGQIGRLDV